VHADEQAIRDLIGTWLRASAAGELDQVLVSALAHRDDIPPIVAREYGCHEFAMTAPDGHVLVFGECG
jgi:hypothetical protein